MSTPGAFVDSRWRMFRCFSLLQEGVKQWRLYCRTFPILTFSAESREAVEVQLFTEYETNVGCRHRFLHSQSE